MINKKTKKYKSFIKAVDKFIVLYDANNIIARRDWTCCNTCGDHEMETLVKTLDEKDPTKRYLGYIFYHIQESYHIREKLETNNDIMIYLNWGYCHDEDKIIDENGIKLAQTIHKIASDNGYMLEFTDFNKKLQLHIMVDI